MNFDYSTRVNVAIILLILFAFLSNIQWLRQALTFDSKLIGHDQITLYEKRFQALKKMLPSHGVVGYVSDKKPHPDGSGRNLEANKGFFLAQYSLSPVILVNTVEAKFVVGNFYNPISQSELYSTYKGLRLVKDLGQGVMLFTSDNQ